VFGAFFCAVSVSVTAVSHSDALSPTLIEPGNLCSAPAANAKL